MSNSNFNPTSRRSMLKAAMVGCGAMTTHVSVMSTLLNLQATKALVANNGATDYKALVCVFLLGGNDSYNMLVPTNGSDTTGEFGDYVTARSGLYHASNNPGGLALQQADLIPLSSNNLPTGRGFGLHPGMNAELDVANPDATNGVAGLFNSGAASFVTNVGSLVGPTSRQIYNNNSNRPLGLFSHSDLQRHWMTGAPHTRSQITGWGGNLAELFQSTPSSTVSMNISLSGTNIYQTGSSVVPYSIGQNGATAVTDYNASGDLQARIFKDQYDNVLGQTYSDLLSSSFANSHRAATDAAIAFNTATSTSTLTTPFDQRDNLSKQLQMIAKTIEAAPALGQNRQIFFVTIGGWDMHAGLISGQTNLLPVVSRALKSFYDATVELGCQDNVVTFTASDFARTLGTNGAGSDHAWGGNHIVMGGGVGGAAATGANPGGKLFGEYPNSLTDAMHTFAVDDTTGSLNLGRGRMIPTTSVDELAAELAMWFGVSSKSDLKTVLPNIENFFDYNNDPPPLGLFT